MSNQSITDGGWEKEFDEKFYDGGEPKHIVAEHPSMNMRYPATAAQIKSFIRTQISEAVEKAKREWWNELEVNNADWSIFKDELRKEGAAQERERIKRLLLELKDAPHEPLPHSYWHGYEVALEHALDSILKDTSHTEDCGHTDEQHLEAGCGGHTTK